MRKILSAALCAVTIATLSLSAPSSVEAKGCPDFYHPFAYDFFTQYLPATDQLYIRIRAWDNDRPGNPELKVFINGVYYTTFFNGYFEGVVNRGIGKIVFKHPKKNQCNGTGQDVEVAKIPWF